MEALRQFQKDFLKKALAPGIDTACYSLPRGNGKSFLAGYILSRCLTPGDDLNQPGMEYILGAASLEQARITFQFVREELEPLGGYRFLDSSTRIGITHTASNTKLRVISSNGKTAMGLGARNPLCVLDEPGAFEVRGGELLWDAIATAQGKPGMNMKVILIGTLAPAINGWWHQLIKAGSQGSTHVTKLQGSLEGWDSWPVIRKANPLCNISSEFRAKLLEERNLARTDTRLKSRFLSYRLNIPTGDESKVLLTIPEYLIFRDRKVGVREGRPIVACDLGGGRSWSSAVCVYPSGLVDAIAVAPGIPDIPAQEKRDRVPTGTYSRLVSSGQLEVAHGLFVQPPGRLWDSILQRWGVPDFLVADKFRLPELLDSIHGACHAEERRTWWSDAAFDIRAVRQLALDGPLSLSPDAVELLETSLEAAEVENDTSGNVRMVKQGSNNASRDDVAFALVLAAGAWKRTYMASPVTVSFNFG